MKGRFDFTVEELGQCKVPSPIKLSKVHGDFIANYVRDDEFVRFNIDVYDDVLVKEADAYNNNLIQKAGPREFIYFNPKHVNAGICTCGGLCPGLNDVIRAIVRCLYYRYGVRRIRGIRYGFKGLLPEHGYDTIDLDPELVDDIHKTGGSFLGTSRGGGDRITEIVDAIEALNMNMIFIVGGDGTQRGALEIAEEIERRNLKVSVIGVPKTVDNDLVFIQRSFGFDTAVQKASEAVAAAHMEAKSHINGIGLIKLMGRESGFIATATVLASHEANFCLIPEVPFDIDGEQGFLAALERRLETRHHAVVVAAEGAGQQLLRTTDEKDASGNKKLGDIGVYLKEKITEYFAAKNIHINLKYIDPSYQIRSSVATPSDSIYCERLGNNAVHAAMAGKTKIVIGLVHDKYVHLPTRLVTKKRNKVNPEGSLWRDAMDATRQPILMLNDTSKYTHIAED
ncbi:MAG: ATP-dependent 6-phosphofructokinase [Bacteroides sp.]|nr:ATP-dependent 6-phosphofructokinase [Prevotella sp.]MCM1407657.1 ATP-dependent 6-phosphofructokinase [Treponema brennaborense]MCM1469193.1 ATP-dependent 6-phosphofructokinase [Bacteroides sp.]